MMHLANLGETVQLAISEILETYSKEVKICQPKIYPVRFC